MSHDRGCFRCFEDQRVCERADCPGKPSLQELAEANGMRLVPRKKTVVTPRGEVISPNDKQVGGDHYQSSLQHWDLVEEFEIGYLESACSKYITRWRKKNGLEDLKKSEHYLVKLISLLDSGQRKSPRGRVPHDRFLIFCRENTLELSEQIVLSKVLQWETKHDIEIGLTVLREMIRLTEIENA